MKHMIFLVALIAMTMPAVSARAIESAQDKPQYTSAEIRKLAREAHTQEQFTVLADYYATRQRMYQRQAAAEMHLWAERNQMVNPIAEKWPRPVDSARNLYEYYQYEATHCAALVAKFSHLADEAAAK